MIGSVRLTHGHTRGYKHSPEYRVWMNIKNRCHKESHPKYQKYGAKGVTVCDRWRHDFEAFMADMGPRPSPRHSIDRIDGSRGYEPENCRWADDFIQNNNRRTVPRITIDGVTKSPREWLRHHGLPIRRYGWLREKGVGPAEALAQLIAQK